MWSPPPWHLQQLFCSRPSRGCRGYSSSAAAGLSSPPHPSRDCRWRSTDAQKERNTPVSSSHTLPTTPSSSRWRLWYVFWPSACQWWCSPRVWTPLTLATALPKSSDFQHVLSLGLSQVSASLDSFAGTGHLSAEHAARGVLPTPPASATPPPCPSACSLWHCDAVRSSPPPWKPEDLARRVCAHGVAHPRLAGGTRWC